MTTTLAVPPDVRSERGRKARETALKRQAHAEVAAAEAREFSQQTIAASPLDVLRLGLPLAKPAPGVKSWQRLVHMDGELCAVRLFIDPGDPKAELPYGNDYLTLVWLATAFKQCAFPEDLTLRIASGADLARWHFPELAKKKVPWVRRQEVASSLKRLSDVAIRILPVDGGSHRLRVKKQDFIIDNMDLGFGGDAKNERKTKQRNQHTQQLEFADHIRFTVFGAELLKHSGPVDAQTLYALRSSPLCVRLYSLEAKRSWDLAQKRIEKQRAPLFGENGLAAELGISSTDRSFIRGQLRNAHARVRRVWKECPNRLVLDPSHPEREGLWFEPGWAIPTERGSKLELPGLIKPQPGVVLPYRPAPDVGDGRRLWVQARPDLDDDDPSPF